MGHEPYQARLATTASEPPTLAADIKTDTLDPKYRQGQDQHTS